LRRLQKLSPTPAGRIALPFKPLDIHEPANAEESDRDLENFGASQNCEEIYPEAGEIIRVEQGVFQKVMEEGNHPEKVFWPFSDRDDWEMAAWIATSGISQRKMASFFKLGHVSVKSSV
jgi:hypothetical protein